MGDNTYSQCGDSGDKQGIFSTFTMVENIKYYNITQIQAQSNSSLFINDQGEMLYSGKISNKKIVQKPKEGEFREQVFVVRVQAYDNGVQIFIKSLPRQDLSTVKILDDQDIQTFKEIKFQIQLKDDLGPYGLEPFSPIRFQIMLIPKEQNLENNDVEQSSITYSQQHRKQFQEAKAYIDEIYNQILLNYEIKKNQDDFSCYDLSIMPFELDIQESQEEKDKKKKEEEIKEFQRKKEQAKYDKKLKKQVEEEERKKKQIEEEELAKKKKEETDLRAKEAYMKHLKEQEDKKLKEDLERVQRKELRTGGGFDLNKLDIQKKQQPLKNQDQNRQFRFF
ncbi:Regulator of chromosome condensation 1/beta-lactamase-inhibitor protein II [Pseudocohnilembus persalinus]|uniref:Regulator of chromosome condensation 1/beta-lactamase-inhibitor protein II n=1 Tax=Pseudocohnilembus persalinus TaxID=266149 RepID=A0A0V0QCQ4_PSEPJ|nr:Regulator of chromosome condensation 1/beta-lactamase-inhibitor protein II [Pseudocohnilembus persalinus]|eukprot:KRW99953.1 Regulator of chromosome condensation 1/beta-lactamase-inhibitor protein II [Pseudocohnilembus persalinus]